MWFLVLHNNEFVARDQRNQLQTNQKLRLQWNIVISVRIMCYKWPLVCYALDHLHGKFVRVLSEFFQVPVEHVLVMFTLYVWVLHADWLGNFMTLGYANLIVRSIVTTVNEHLFSQRTYVLFRFMSKVRFWCLWSNYSISLLCFS